ncbi:MULTISPECIES: transposase [Streptomyces]|uniref:transposase n=2 Tax=Streptomyces TaxID=1883 RepID=UPI00030C95C8|nr:MULTISPECIES: transposase [Streptomyces]
MDGTLIPVHDQQKTRKSKNYRRSVNVQIVCRARDRRVVAVGDAWPGNRNDVMIFRETMGRTLPAHPRLSGDGGYQGIERIRSPRRGLTGRSSRTGPTGGSASAAPSPNTPSHASRTTRFSASAAAKEKGSTTPSPASPPCTT